MARKRSSELFDFDQHRVLFWCLATLFIGLFIGDLIFSWPRARTRDFLLGRFASEKRRRRRRWSHANVFTFDKRFHVDDKPRRSISLSLSELSQTLENLSESFHLGSSPINNDMGRTSNVAPWSYVPARWNEKTSIVKNSQRNFVVGRASWKILTKQEVDECVCLANQHRYSRFIAEDAKISDDRISHRN